MFHAVFLITIGLLLLMNNLGNLSWDIWGRLIPYWPVLIIFVGIDVILGKSKLGRFVASLINIIIFLTIITRVIGLQIPYLKNIPLPEKRDKTQELYFSEKKSSDNIF